MNEERRKENQEGEPKKKNFFFAHLFDLILLLSLVALTASVYVVRAIQKSQVKSKDLSANVSLKGELLATIALYEEGENERLIPFQGTRGVVTVGVKKNAIRVHHADCPGQECVHEGWVTEANHPIICAHNGIYISISSYDWSEVIIR